VGAVSSRMRCYSEPGRITVDSQAHGASKAGNSDSNKNNQQRKRAMKSAKGRPKGKVLLEMGSL